MQKGLRAADVEALLREIQRYLAYVEAFRKTAEPKSRNGEEEQAQGG